jgi:3-oxoacyl-[acyl-carrier-protein] synthase II
MNNIVITGIGLATPLGLGREKTWGQLLLSKSAVAPDLLNPEILTARVEGLNLAPETRMLSLAFLAAAEALSDSGLNPIIVDYTKLGCTLSSSKPNLLNSAGNKIVFSEIFLQSTVGMQVARVLRLGGRVINVSAACATGAVSIIEAARLIESGECDAVVAGAVEVPFHPLYVAGFSQMGVLAKNIVCPFDKKREGFALAEGAGSLVLERKDIAVLRGARIYGELSGWGMSCDTKNTVTFDPSGKNIALAAQKALAMSELGAVGYINAHGTGTQLNDLMETRAYRAAFGNKLYDIPVSSTKAATGHLLGASGAVEAAFCLLALRDGALPPTLNLTDPDTDCGLSHIPHRPLERNIDSAMSVSYGFGGQIAALCFRK